MEAAKAELRPGLTSQLTFNVEKKHLASEIGSGEARVFSTPMLVAGCEAAAVAVAKPFLASGQTTVGIHIDIHHDAATPLGMAVNFKATLERISENGKCLYFDVLAWDAAGPIGHGKHERVIVELAKFEQKTEEKLEKAS